MKKILVCLSVFFCFFAVSAQTGKSRIAYVNTLELFSYAPQRKALETRLRQESQKMQSALSEKQNELSLLKKKLEETNDTSEKEKLRREVLDKETLMTRRSDAIQDAFLLKRNDEMAAFQKMIYEVIADVAETYEYDIVFAQSSVVYVNENVDITELVMQALTTKFREGKKGTDNISAPVPANKGG